MLSYYWKFKNRSSSNFYAVWLKNPSPGNSVRRRRTPQGRGIKDDNSRKIKSCPAFQTTTAQWFTRGSSRSVCVLKYIKIRLITVFLQSTYFSTLTSQIECFLFLLYWYVYCLFWTFPSSIYVRCINQLCIVKCCENTVGSEFSQKLLLSACKEVDFVKSCILQKIWHRSDEIVMPVWRLSVVPCFSWIRCCVQY